MCLLLTEKKTGKVTKAINSVPRFAIVGCEILQKLIWAGNYSQKGSYKMEEYYRWLKIAKGKYKRSLLPWLELNLNYWNKYLFLPSRRFYVPRLTMQRYGCGCFLTLSTQITYWCKLNLGNEFRSLCYSNANFVLLKEHFNYCKILVFLSLLKSNAGSHTLSSCLECCQVCFSRNVCCVWFISFGVNKRKVLYFAIRLSCRIVKLFYRMISMQW